MPAVKLSDLFWESCESSESWPVRFGAWGTGLLEEVRREPEHVRNAVLAAIRGWQAGAHVVLPHHVMQEKITGQENNKVIHGL
jgi:hypothetical protein